VIVLFTDFGLEGPYIGQMKAVLYQKAPGFPIIDLFSDAPVHDPKACAYLLAAYAQGFPNHSIFLTIVDPGVGGPRRALAVRIGTRWFVGPDNGLLELLVRRTQEEVKAWEILWKPRNCSASFHGRDIFSPIAARLISGQTPEMSGNENDFREIDVSSIRRTAWPDDLAEIIYFDHFGNAMTGIRALIMKYGQGIRVGDYSLPVAETFTDVVSGDMFCYENANGLMEIAVNQGQAKDMPGLKLGGEISIIQL